MLVRARVLSLLACANFLPEPASSGTALPSPPEASTPAPEIVVEGLRNVYRRDLDQVRAITVKRDGQIARFEGPVCPSVSGLPRDHASVVETKIAALVVRLGLRADHEGCRPNLTVMIADRPREVIAALRKSRPGLFDTMNHGEIDHLDNGHGPAWTWYSVDHKRKDGAPVEKISEIAVSGAPEPTPRGTYIVNNASMSLLSSPVRTEIAGSFVVLDLNSIDGLTLQQVADLAAVLGLSMIDVDRIEAIHTPSILSLLFHDDGGERRPAEVTRFDLGYLKSLYTGDPGDTYDQRSARMVSFMEQSQR